MKKLFAILLALLMVFALPLTAFAEDAEPSEELTQSATEDTSEDTSNVGGVDDPDSVTVKTNFGFFPSSLSQTLPIMGMGMLGIFLVTSVIILAVLVLSKFGGKTEED